MNEEIARKLVLDVYLRVAAEDPDPVAHLDHLRAGVLYLLSVEFYKLGGQAQELMPEDSP